MEVDGHAEVTASLAADASKVINMAPETPFDPHTGQISFRCIRLTVCLIAIIADSAARSSMS